MSNAYNKSLGFFPFPAVEGGAGDPSDVLGGGDGFAIGKNAPPETIDFVRYLTSLDIQKAMAAANLAVLPVVKGAETALDDPLMQGSPAARRRRPSTTSFTMISTCRPAVGADRERPGPALFAGTALAEEVAKAIEDSAAQRVEEVDE